MNVKTSIKLLLLCCLISLIKSNESLFEKGKIKSEEIQEFGPLTEENHREIQDSLEMIKSFILVNKKTTSNEFLSFKADQGHKDNIFCKGCLWIFNSTQKLLLKKYGWKILFEIVSVLCSIGLNHKICFEYIDAYGGIVLEGLIDHYLTPEFICSSFYLCSAKHYITLTGDDYAKGLLKDKPMNLTKPMIDTNAPVWKVLHVTDIHVDLHYSEGSRGLCPTALCCRNESIAQTMPLSTEAKAGKWGFLGSCDIPMRTLENFCDKVFNEIKPDFVIWTGDNPAHAAYDTSAFEVARVFSELMRTKYNYTLPVYPSLGNHEKYPADEFNFFDNTREKPFLKTYGDLWKDWIGEEAYQTFTQTGAYTIKHPNSNLRIISTNCMLCDAINFFLIRNPTDPQDQIEWMEKVLRKAEKDNEVVYLISHIPPGDVSFTSECARRYKALLDRFSHIVREQFYGHTHFDELKVMHEYFDSSKVSSVIYIAPSLTTIFEVDSNTKITRDFIQYRLNITKANSDPEVTPKWEISYNATSLYNVTFLNETESIAQFSNSITTNVDTYNKLIDAFFTSGPLVKEYYSLKKMPRYLSCRFNVDIFDDYYRCIGYITWDPEEYAYKLLNKIEGSWFKRLPE